MELIVCQQADRIFVISASRINPSSSTLQLHFKNSNEKKSNCEKIAKRTHSFTLFSTNHKLQAE